MHRTALQEAKEQLRTLRDLIRWSVTQFEHAEIFFGHGTDNAWDEAITLALHTVAIPHHLLDQVFDSNLTYIEREEIIRLVLKRVEKRLPLPYITNEAWFAGLPFYVDERVIIPRSPLAEAIENHFAPWVDADNVKNILDLCCGSGCIAIACAHAFDEAQVDASDISQDSLDVAAINVEKYHLHDRVALIQSDLFNEIHDKRYDIIVSNPPYVDEIEMENLSEEFQHEPKLSLIAGKDGLDFVRRILLQAENYLTDQGVLIVEVGFSQKALENAFPRVPFIWLDFERGGEGVFLLTKQQLREYHKYFQEK